MDKWEEQFLREIVELDTNSDEKKNYAVCAEVIKKYCQEAGLEVEVFDSMQDGIPQPNVVATMDVGAISDVHDSILFRESEISHVANTIQPTINENPPIGTNITKSLRSVSTQP